MGCSKEQAKINGQKGGRPSAYQERSNAEDALDIWYTDRTRAELAAKIKSGTYSVRDMFVFKALGGNEKILTALQKKIHPDKLDVAATGEIKVVVMNYGNDDKPAAQLQPSEPPVPAGRAA